MRFDEEADFTSGKLSMGSARWQAERRALNHDWLKNRHLPALRRALHWLRGELVSSDLSLGSFRALVDSFLSESLRVEALIRAMPEDLSPKVLLGCPPLVNIPAKQRACFAPVLHRHWLAEFSIDSKLANCSQALVDARDAHVAIGLLAVGEACADAKNGGGRSELEITVSRAVEATSRLARAIEVLPSDVLIPSS